MSKPQYITTYIRIFSMEPVYEKRETKVQVGTKKVKKKTGFFRSQIVEVEEPVYEKRVEWVPTDQTSDTHIDIKELAEEIMKACNEMHEKGYEVINILAINSGRYQKGFVIPLNSDAGYGFGYSITDGVIIVGKLRES